MRIVFAGTPEFAVQPLKALLHSKHSVIAVFTQPDRPAGRGQTLHQSPVKALGQLHHIPVYQPNRLKNSEEQAKLLELQPDLLIVVAYGLLLPKTILDIPKFGCINIHASLLPRWRGAAPIQHAVLAGDKMTGICTMQMDEGLDTGDILLRIPCTITPQETSKTLHDKLATLGAVALLETLEKLEKNALVPEKQDPATATIATKISKADAKIDWQESAEVIDRKIRAFNPWPVAFAELSGQTIRIWSAKTNLTATVNHKIKPGAIIEIHKDSMDIATGDGVLTLLEMQLPGGKRLPVGEILHAKGALFLDAIFV
ncbi:MAG TPA: methionyl-tRNA formyltransferase [Gammaproteobacteria bacterium]|nr:methionyl-tRNA formyltransferase [Gammaproteobacteria bacterium]